MPNKTESSALLSQYSFISRAVRPTLPCPWQALCMACVRQTCLPWAETPSLAPCNLLMQDECKTYYIVFYVYYCVYFMYLLCNPYVEPMQEFSAILNISGMQDISTILNYEEKTTKFILFFILCKLINKLLNWRIVIWNTKQSKPWTTILSEYPGSGLTPLKLPDGMTIIDY